MNLKECADEIKRLPIATEFLEEAAHGGYLCIADGCNNGGGTDGTGASLFNDDTRLGCRVCEKTFTNIEVIAHYLGIPVTGEKITGKDFVEVVKCGADYFGLELDEGDSFGYVHRNFKPVPAPSKAQPTIKKKAPAVFTRSDEARANIKKIIEAGGGALKFRGLRLDMMSELGWGFLPDFLYPGHPQFTTHGALIIPNDFGGTFARDVAGDYKDNFSPVGPTVIYLPAGTDFILIAGEGAINTASALAAVRAVKSEVKPALGFVALGATSGKKNFMTWLKDRYPDTNACPQVVVMLDNDLKKPNDNPGQKAAKELLEMLIKAGFAAANVIIDEDGRDLNDLLQDIGDEALGRRILDAVAGAQDELHAAADALKELAIKEGESALSKREAVRAKRREETKTAREIFSDCPVDVHIPQPFVLDTAALTYGRKFVSVPVVITKNLVGDGGNEYAEIAYRDPYGGSWRRRIIDKLTIADARRILELASYGVGVTSSTAKLLSEYLTRQLYEPANVAVIPTQRIFGHTGWTDDDSNFIYPAGDVIVHNGRFNYAEAFASEGDFETWRQMALKVLDCSTAARFVLGAALAAPLLKPLKLPNQWLHLDGRSGRGKTAALYFAASIYGAPDKLAQSLNGTSNALESIGALFSDLPHFLIEMQTVSKAARESMDKDLYTFAEGRGRLRCNRDGGLQTPRKFRGIRISDGEQSLTTEHSGAGAFKRTFELKCDKGVFDNDFAVSLYKFVAENHGLACDKWIKTVKTNMPRIRKFFDLILSELEREWPDAYPNHRVFAAAVYAAGAFFEVEVLGRPSSQSTFIMNTQISPSSDMVNIFGDLPKVETSANAVRAVQTVADFFTQHEGNFLDYNDDENDLDADRNKNRLIPREVYGYRTRYGDVAFIPSVLKNALADYPSVDAVIREFARLGYLEVGKDKARPFMKAVKISGKTRWVIVLKRSVLFNDGNTADAGEKNDIGENPPF